MDKKSYNALGFKTLGWLDLFPAILGRKAREANGRVRPVPLLLS